MKGDGYYAAAVQKLIKQWETDSNGKRRFVEEKLWKDYVSSLISLGAASKGDLAYVYYAGGAKIVDSLVNPDNKLLPIVLRINTVERVLKLQTADFMENPVDYKVRMELPLDKIFWAAIRSVSNWRGNDNTTEDIVFAATDTEGASAKKTAYSLVVYAKSSAFDGALVFLVPLVEDESGKPKQTYFEFVHKLQTLSPFYCKEDGQEYFDVEL